jgi:hypothetical protein
MKEEADFEVAGAEIVEYLPWSGFVELVCGLGFHNEFLVDEHVDSLLT